MIITKIMWKYRNGNTTVSIDEDGTKIREYEGIPSIVRPESSDVKITDYCDAGCAFCHENSTTVGKHCEAENFKKVFSGDVYGMEIAIGGGNPLSHPELDEILKYCKEKEIIANITVNAKHIEKYGKKIKKYQEQGLLYGIGISYRAGMDESIKKFSKEIKNAVIHFISGIDNFKTIMSFNGERILILGYKDFGRGIFYKDFLEKESFKELYRNLPEILNNGNVSFDTLAINQLGVERFFEKEKWNEMFMGEEGKFSMYVDLVKMQFAVSSFSEKRTSIESDIRGIFKFLSI